MSGHASPEEALEVMREAYRKVFGVEMPESDVDGVITVLSFTQSEGRVVVNVRLVPPGDDELWQGSDL